MYSIRLQEPVCIAASTTKDSLSVEFLASKNVWTLFSIIRFWVRFQLLGECPLLLAQQASSVSLHY